jgi:predicted O-methyltransferase YrrM
MAEEWRGTGTVLEAGTLFGKSTQAIALGMMANPRCHTLRLVSLDSFGKYFEPAEMTRQLGPLIDKDPGWPAAQEAFATEGFERAYRLIHAHRPYAGFHEIHRVLIPMRQDDSDTVLRGVLDSCGTCDVAFIDSAKAWYPVRALTAALCAHLAEGALVVWQDYRWFNSYAIPVFHSLFAAHFSLLAAADNTQVFRYLGGLTPATVLARMPAAVAGLGAAAVEPMLRSVAAESVLRNDAYGAISAGLQLAFALFDCGAHERAREIVAAISSSPAFSAQRALFELAHAELVARA